MTRPAPRWLLPAVLMAGAAVHAGFRLLLHGDWLALEQGPVLCPFRLITGWPCPGCGMTRCLVACAMGEWVRAAAYHPLGIPLLVAVLATGLAAWLPEPLQRRWQAAWHWRHWPSVALSLVVGVWVWRLIG